MSSHSFPTHKQKLTQSQEGGRRKERQRMKAFTKACIFYLSLSLFLSLPLSLSFYFLVFFLHTQIIFKNFFLHTTELSFFLPRHEGLPLNTSLSRSDSSRVPL